MSNPAHAALLLAVGQFNRRKYFATHETLEEIWKAERGPERAFYQGIIQIAAAFVHLQRGNHAGALSLLRRGIENLAPFVPECRGMDATALVRDARRCEARIETLGPEGIGSFPWEQAPMIRYVDRPRG